MCMVQVIAIFGIMKIVVKIIAFAITIILFGACETPYKPKDGWQKHENYTHKFTIYYPPSWKFSNQGNPNLVFYVSSPKKDEYDYVQENVNMIAQSVAAETTLENYIAELEKKAGGQLQNVTKTTDEHLDFKGFDAIYGVYQASVNDIQVKWDQYAWLNNGQVFILTYSAESSQYEAYKETAFEVIESLRFH